MPLTERRTYTKAIRKVYEVAGVPKQDKPAKGTKPIGMQARWAAEPAGRLVVRLRGEQVFSNRHILGGSE